MNYKVERAIETDRDLEAIFDFLAESYIAFGESREVALERAAERIESIENDMMSLAKAPHQGTACADLLSGLRSVTKQRAIFYFDIDDDERRVRVLAVFFGGQEHRRQMLKRIFGPG